MPPIRPEERALITEAIDAVKRQLPAALSGHPVPAQPGERPLSGPAALLSEEILKEVRRAAEGLPDLFRSVSQKIKIDDVLAKSGSLGDITIGQVILGDATIGAMKLQNTAATVHTGNATLRGVSMNLELKIYVDWWYDIGIWDDHGTWDLGSLWFGFTIGDVAVPSLSDINVNVPNVTVSNVHAQMAPINNLILKGGVFEKLKAQKTTLPVDGFQLQGMSMTGLALDNVKVPKVNVAEASIAHFKPNEQVVLPGATVSGVSIPATSIPAAQSPAFNLDAVTQERSLSVNAGVLGVTVRVVPIAHMHIESMALQNLTLSASVGSVGIENIRIPVDVKSILMKNLALEDVSVSQITG